MPSIPTLRIQVLADHRKRVLELHEPAQREVLALDRNDHAVEATSALMVSRPSDGGVSIRTVVVGVPHRCERFLERTFAADHARERKFAPARSIEETARSTSTWWITSSDRKPVHEHIEHRPLIVSGIQALAHGQVALWIEVDKQNLQPLLGEGDAEIERRRRSATPPFWFANEITRPAGGPFAVSVRIPGRGNRRGKPHRAPFFALMPAILRGNCSIFAGLVWVSLRLKNRTNA